MTATEKLIAEMQKDPHLKNIQLTPLNVRNAVFYVDEITHCEACKGYEECQNHAQGIMPVFDEKGLSYKSCPYALQIERRNNVNSRFASNYLAEATLEGFDTSTEARQKTLKYAYQVLESGKKGIQGGLYIYGNFGTGKTYFLSALANALAQENIRSIIVFMPDLSRDLKNAMSDNSLEGKVNALKKVDVLMLDDLGGEMMTSWLRDEIIAPIIQYRTVNHLPIFITSNLDYSGLREHFSETRDDLDGIKANRILERIKSMTKRVSFDEKFKK